MRLISIFMMDNHPPCQWKLSLYLLANQKLFGTMVKSRGFVD